MKIEIKEKDLLKMCDINDDEFADVVFDQIKFVVGEKVAIATKPIIFAQFEKHKSEIAEKINKRVEGTLMTYLKSKRFKDDVERLVINQMSDAVRYGRNKPY